MKAQEILSCSIHSVDIEEIYQGIEN